MSKKSSLDHPTLKHIKKAFPDVPFKASEFRGMTTLVVQGEQPGEPVVVGTALLQRMALPKLEQKFFDLLHLECSLFLLDGQRIGCLFLVLLFVPLAFQSVCLKVHCHYWEASICLITFG